MNWGSVLLIGVSTCIVSWIATSFILRILRKLAILDQPNERSSHTTRTPRGGGIAIITIVIVGWLLVWLFEKNYVPASKLWLLLVAGTMLALISFLDDIYNNLHPFVRLFLQGIAVTAGVISLPQGHGIFHAILPTELDLAASGIIWLWFINLFNFMDGIDGIASSQAATAALGIFGTFLLIPGIVYVDTYALILAAAAIGFLPWNWQPARVFLGDAGSMVLGFILSWLLIYYSHPTIRLIHPVQTIWCVALPVFDLLGVIIRRILRGINPFKSDRRHIHHILLDLNFSTINVLLILLSISCILSIFGGFIYFNFGPLPTLLSYFILFLIYLFFSLRLSRKIFLRNNKILN